MGLKGVTEMKLIIENGVNGFLITKENPWGGVYVADSKEKLLTILMDSIMFPQQDST